MQREIHSPCKVIWIEMNDKVWEGTRRWKEKRAAAPAAAAATTATKAMAELIVISRVLCNVYKLRTLVDSLVCSVSHIIRLLFITQLIFMNKRYVRREKNREGIAHRRHRVNLCTTTLGDRWNASKRDSILLPPLSLSVSVSRRPNWNQRKKSVSFLLPNNRKNKW